jgi:hypothetical protein
VSDGSPNDLKLRSIIGDNWKVMCGAEQPVLEPKCTPGFRHSQYWPMAMDRLRPLLNQADGKDARDTVTEAPSSSSSCSALDTMGALSAPLEEAAGAGKEDAVRAGAGAGSEA